MPTATYVRNILVNFDKSYDFSWILDFKDKEKKIGFM